MRPEPTRVETRAPMVERRATSGTEVALEQAIGRNERLITRRRSEPQSSMILRDALVERHIPMSQVIAVSATPDASRATIYYRPQE